METFNIKILKFRICIYDSSRTMKCSSVILIVYESTGLFKHFLVYLIVHMNQIHIRNIFG